MLKYRSFFNSRRETFEQMSTQNVFGANVDLILIDPHVEAFFFTDKHIGK